MHRSLAHRSMCCSVLLSKCCSVRGYQGVLLLQAFVGASHGKDVQFAEVRQHRRGSCECLSLEVQCAELAELAEDLCWKCVLSKWWRRLLYDL